RPSERRMFEWPLIPAGLALLLGGALVMRGLRGRRRGDGQYCRRCSYDLAGLSSQRCPECGNELSAPGAVVVGRRSIRITPLAAGLLLLLVAAPVLVGTATSAFAPSDLWPWAPTELVLRSASAGSAAARAEALRRLRMKQLDTAS